MVKASFATSWKASTQPRKQRKYRANAPLHLKANFVHVHLSPQLREKYSKRNVQIHTGDKVKIMKGQFKKQEGKVERVDLKRELVYVTGMENIKIDGNKVLAPLTPSNLMIIELDTSDKKRKEKLGSKDKETKEVKVTKTTQVKEKTEKKEEK